jgi:pimeloyl-ACP methyl ester carboxylesterase
VGHNVVLGYQAIGSWIPTNKEVSFGIMRRVHLALLLSLFASTVFASEVTLEHDGLTLNAKLEMAAAGDVSDGVIVILHGTLGHNDMEIIASLQGLLLENDRNSLAINLSLNVDDRHGFLPCDTEHSHKMDDASDELAAWISWLVSQGATNIVILGHSRGGNQVARFIVDSEPDVIAAILIAPSVGVETTNADREEVLHLALSAGWLKEVQFLHCSDATVSSGSYLSYYGPANRMDTPALLERIEIPVLVFSGSEDTVVPALAERMVKVKQDNVTFEEIDGAGHFFRDLYLYDVVDSILVFLDASE